MNRTDASNDQTAANDAENDVMKDALQCVLDDFIAAETARSDHESDWDRYFRKYSCILDKGKYPWRSKVFDPEAYAMIETICPRITNTLLGGAEVFGIKPTGNEDVQKAENTERLLNYQADRMNLYEVGGEGFKEALIYGTGLWKLRWCKEFEPRYETVPRQQAVQDENGNPMVDDMGMPQMEIVEDYKKSWVVVYDNPKLDRVDIKALYPDPLADSVESARYMIHRFYRSRDYLKKKKLEGIYKWDGEIPATPSASTSDSRESDKKNAERTTVVFNDKQLDDVELLERWGLFDIDGDGYLEECVITVANRSTVLRVEYNKLPGAHKPFIRYTPIPIPGSFYGMSSIQPIDSITDALNDRTNQIGDAINLTINPMYKKVRWSEIDDDDCVSRPGGVIEMNSLGDLEPLALPAFPPAAFGEISRFEGKIQKASGVFDVARGTGDPNAPATTTIALQNVAEIRFKTMAMLAERQFIRPLGSNMIRYNRVYMSQPRQIRVIGNDFLLDPSNQQMGGMNPQMGQGAPGMGMQDPNQGGFIEVSKENLAQDPDIYAVGAALEIGTSKEMQLNNMLKFMQVTANPAFMQNPLFSIDYSALVERFPYLMNMKLKRPVVMKGNPMLAYQEMQQQKAQEQAQQQGDRAIADQMMIQHMTGQGGGPPGGPGGAPVPSRVEGELKKSDVPANQPQEE